MKSNLIFDEKVLERGKQYASENRVHLLLNRPSVIKVMVQGKMRYFVELQIRKNTIVYAHCTCPYMHGNCKHIAAAIYSLTEGKNE